MATVPAWKRLGLKLKGSSSDSSPVSTAAQTTTTTFTAPSATRPHSYHHHHQQQNNANAGDHYGSPGFNKRKQLPPSTSYPASDFKRPRRNDSNFTPSKKSVSFSQDSSKPAPKKPKQKKAPKQPPPPKQPFDLTPVLEYLRTWNTARDTWKFNKNHQTLLIKHLYASDAIPPADIDAFYMYIRDIKGASRQRLVEQAQDIRKKDMENGPKGFPEGVKAPEEKQKEYEEMLAELLNKKAELKSGGDGVNGTSKRTFDEMEFVLRTVDKGIQQRIVKRMRAETVIDELESSDTSDSTDSATASTAHATASRAKVATTNDDANGAKQKSKRKKKLRTADSDSSSSSDSDSDSDSSDSDSDLDDVEAAGQDAAGDGGSSSSSESDSDEEMDTANDLHDNSSSSSSSSSSESGSDTESAGAGPHTAGALEDTSGSDGDSESSDSDSDGDGDDV